MDITITQWLDDHEIKADYLPGMTMEEFTGFLCDYMLDKDYCLVDPVSASQARVYILLDILERTSPKYRKEMSEWLRKKE